MSHWNYRVVRHSGGGLTLIEAYYNDNSEITSWSWVGSPIGDDLEELAADLDLMTRALDHPVVPRSELP